MKILLFGITKDIIGDSKITLPRDISLANDLPATVGELRKLLINDFPELGALSSLKIAINKDFAEDNLQINSLDEIALIPPVSGG